jgi:hypothetical protein
LIESYREQRPLWLASVEAFLQGGRSEEVRALLAWGNEEARRGMTAWLEGVPESEVADDAVSSLGSVQVALISGLMLQWLNDPDHAPSAEEVVRGLREIADHLSGPPRARRGRADRDL